MNGLKQEILFKHNKDKKYISLQIDGKEEGLISWEVFTEKKVLEIHMIYVEVKFQRKGYGTKLIYEMLKKYPNYESVYLHTAATNSNAIKFYLNAGFEFIFRYQNFYNLERDALFLIKKLKTYE